jgi:enoyl-CoA hydratase/carnithine racemase
MAQTYETLQLEKRERVAIITINRPDKRNALNIKTREEGAALLEELRNDSSVGVVVFTGAGDKAFIAGADIGEFAGRTSITQRDVMTGRSLFTAIDSFPKPVIAIATFVLRVRRHRLVSRRSISGSFPVVAVRNDSRVSSVKEKRWR